MQPRRALEQAIAGVGFQFRLMATQTTGLSGTTLEVRTAHGRGRLQLPATVAQRLEELFDFAAPVIADPLEEGDALVVEALLLEPLLALEAAIKSRATIAVPAKALDDPVSLDLHVTANGLDAVARVDLERSLAKHLAERLEAIHPPESVDSRLVPVMAVLQAGWQDLTQEEIESLRPGDAVMMEGGERVVVADRLAAPLRFDPERGDMVLEAEFAAIAPRLVRDIQGGSDAQVQSRFLVVAVERGRIRTDLASIREWSKGTSIRATPESFTHVDLVVADQPIARGVLVTIGTARGVRILEGGERRISRNHITANGEER